MCTWYTPLLLHKIQTTTFTCCFHTCTTIIFHKIECVWRWSSQRINWVIANNLEGPVAYFWVHVASVPYFFLSTLYRSAIYGTSGSLDFGSVSREHWWRNFSGCQRRAQIFLALLPRQQYRHSLSCPVTIACRRRTPCWQPSAARSGHPECMPPGQHTGEWWAVTVHMMVRIRNWLPCTRMTGRL